MKYGLYLIGILLLNCGDSTLFEGANASKNNIQSVFFVNIGATSATLAWSCTEEMDAYVSYGQSSLNAILPSLTFGKSHIVTIGGLIPQTDYVYSVTCGKKIEDITWINSFRTNISDEPIKSRGIWLIGGIGTDGAPVGQIDLYDPLENKWYPNISTLPTPRAFSNIAVYKNKIYVMGGLVKSGATFSATDRVDEYDPFKNSWRQVSSMPDTHQSGNAIATNNSIVIIAGSTSEAMLTGTLTNTVYEFFPNSNNGSWSKYVSNNAIFQRIDMASCNVGGSLFFTGGRRTSDGSPFATSDGYVIGSNSTTSVTESALNVARHGSATACYNPNSFDPFPSDPPGILVVGGSVSSNLAQPATGIVVSNTFEFSPYTPSAFNSYSNLPVGLYFPSMEVSYELRKAFVFGGETSLNNLSDSIFSLDLSNPATSTWQTVTSKLPIKRYGQKSIILSH